MLYKILAQLNKALLPSFTKQGKALERLNSWEKALLGYKIWVTLRALK